MRHSPEKGAQEEAALRLWHPAVKSHSHVDSGDPTCCLLVMQRTLIKAYLHTLTCVNAGNETKKQSQTVVECVKCVCVCVSGHSFTPQVNVITQ